MSVHPLLHVNFRPSSATVENLPYPSASDRKPISLAFRPSRFVEHTRDDGARRLFNVPEWLLEDEDFIKEVETAMQSWTETRQRGLAGIEEFNEMMSVMARDFLRSTNVRARATAHRFDVSVGLLPILQHNSGTVSSHRFYTKHCMCILFLARSWTYWQTWTARKVTGIRCELRVSDSYEIMLQNWQQLLFRSVRLSVRKLWTTTSRRTRPVCKLLCRKRVAYKLLKPVCRYSLKSSRHCGMS